MNNTEESQFQIRVARIDENIGDVKSVTKVLIHVFFWSKLRGLTLSLEDGDPIPPISNKENIVDVQLKIVHDGKSKPFGKPFPTICTVEVGSDEPEAKEDKLKFDNKTHNVMLVTVNNIPIGTKPVGTRRKAVFYEDTDIIDSGDIPLD